ncbi:MAG TPA: hypothetical protein VFN02_02580 [Ktedonobacteraceae bacterium]|nr:hypothetical protein [Ktedonobacteraceae bacterium]
MGDRLSLTFRVGMLVLLFPDGMLQRREERNGTFPTQLDSDGPGECGETLPGVLAW